MSRANLTQFPDLGSDLTGNIIKAAIEVHRELGPGLLESVYETCLAYELEKAGLRVEKQVTVPVIYKDIHFEQGFRLDLWINREVIIELKAVEKILPIHKAQLATYMRLSKTPLGLIFNFNERLLKNGIERIAITDQL